MLKQQQEEAALIFAFFSRSQLKEYTDAFLEHKIITNVCKQPSKYGYLCTRNHDPTSKG